MKRFAAFFGVFLLLMPLVASAANPFSPPPKFTSVPGKANSTLTGSGVFASGKTSTTAPVTTFTPASISGLNLWLDSSDASTVINTAGAVTAWNDKSGNGYNGTQGTSGSRPVTGTRTINGLNVIDFDGVDDFLSVPIAALGATNPALTIAAVYFPDDTTSGNIISADGFGGSSNRTRLANQEQDFGSIALTRSGVVSSVTIIHIARTPTGSGSVNRMKINSDAEVSSAPSTRGTTPVTLAAVGAYGTGASSRFNGTIAEIAVWQRQLTNDEANQMGNYYATKWGGTYSVLP